MDTKEQEHIRSKIIWNAIREIMKYRSENISFSEVHGGYSITPINIRWKNFFLNNIFWGYKGPSQKKMILTSKKISEITERFKFETMNLEKYINDLKNINFSIYLTDSEKSQKDLQNQLVDRNENYVIITQKDDKSEEHITTIVAKLYFIKRGYLVGEFGIPSKYDMGYGIPDVVGIKGDFVNKLKSRGIIPKGGDESDFLIWSELKKEPIHTNEKTETIVCEVKSSGAWNSAFKQLYERNGGSGYLKSHCFNKAYACFGTLYGKDMPKPSAKYEAGSLIFTSGSKPIVFLEDTISSNPSSSRKADSVLVQEMSQNELIKLANKTIARRMIANLSAKKVIPDIDNLTINQICKQIENIHVENVLEATK